MRNRVVDPGSLPQGRVKLRARGVDALTLGDDTIELRAVEQIVDPAQVTGIGLVLLQLARRGVFDGSRTLAEALRIFDEEVRHRGIAAVDEQYTGDFAVPRSLEVAAALNRLRSLRVARLH